MKEKYKYIYGPVNSWRLGQSLGIDLISTKQKNCSFNCIYCQLGRKGKLSKQRRIYVETDNILEEFNNVIRENKRIDYITFSGMGEPTLALNLGEVIKGIKKRIKSKIPIAVLTNSSLIDLEDVKSDLKLTDFVLFKLDVSSNSFLKKINRPVLGIKFDKIVKGIEEFKQDYQGKLALQIMFIEENKHLAKDIVKIAKQIEPDEIQINTPLRPCKVKPLNKEEIREIEKEFNGLNVINVYDAKNRKKDKHIVKNSVIKRRFGFDISGD